MFKINRHTASRAQSSPWILQLIKKIVKASFSIVISEIIVAFFFMFNPKIARKLGIGKNAHPVRDK